MRTSTRLIAGAATLALALGATTTAIGAQGPGGGGPAGPGSGTGPVATGEVDEETAGSIAYMREEERLARDLYEALDEHHGGLAPFTSITVSEQRHHDAAGRLITAYGLEDPSAGLDAGEYAFPELQALYDDWLARGLTSPQEAFQVGIELETADIADLEEAIEQIEVDQVDRVLGNLLTGSEHHLAAFEAAAAGELPAVGQGAGQQQGRGAQAPQRHGQGQGGPQRQGPRSGSGSGPDEGRQGRGQHQGMGMGMGPGQRQGNGTCPYVEESED